MSRGGGFAYEAVSLLTNEFTEFAATCALLYYALCK